MLQGGAKEQLQFVHDYEHLVALTALCKPAADIVANMSLREALSLPIFLRKGKATP